MLHVLPSRSASRVIGAASKSGAYGTAASHVTFDCPPEADGAPEEEDDFDEEDEEGEAPEAPHPVMPP